jgi:hypothetical protein
MTQTYPSRMPVARLVTPKCGSSWRRRYLRQRSKTIGCLSARYATCSFRSLNHSKAGTLMKMIAEYLEHALQFEHMAASETNHDLKTRFLKQAADYRELCGRLGDEVDQAAW